MKEVAFVLYNLKTSCDSYINNSNCIQLGFSFRVRIHNHCVILSGLQLKRYVNENEAVVRNDNCIESWKLYAYLKQKTADNNLRGAQKLTFLIFSDWDFFKSVECWRKY